MVKPKHKSTRSPDPQGSCQARFGASPAVAGRMGREGRKLSKLGKRWENLSTRIKIIYIGNTGKPQSWSTWNSDSPVTARLFKRSGLGQRRFSSVSAISQLSKRSRLFEKVGNEAEGLSSFLATFNKVLIDSSQAFFQAKEDLPILMSIISASCSTKNSHLVSESVILNAQHKGYGHVIIAQAAAEGRYLLVQDANRNRFQFCADHHPALRPLTDQQLASFTVDPAGSGLHWADLDLDVDLDGLHAGATHHETPSSNSELDNYRSTTGRALGLWLKQHPDIPGQLSDEAGRHVSAVLSGSADLRTSMIRELARPGSMDPHVVLEQLAELRRHLRQVTPLPP